ncbi:AraC-type DNA-binding protein [Clostridium cavendishii DSM 21758]|uniref:AraC-type DNA-binding protein n=1 Tax=Clostridium cavendishii DSM 21758 TaxID=1121302 RepID=A0A1M6DHL3_9CLOT|nr:AraC family transcriptional regulator [Clostridium cavendishii]SHI72498.1 AraC-type DNA-binding protein [Clostridium cavendishii DSM 21758]
MNNILNTLHEPCLIKHGFYLDKTCTKFNTEGLTYSLPPEKGYGNYWVYAYKNLFSISIHDFVLSNDLFFEYKIPKYLSISYYESGSGEEFKPYNRISCGFIKGFIGNNSLYQALFHKHIPVKSIGIEIMPEYYKDYLQKKYNGEYNDPCSAFLSIDGASDFPELVTLLKQIKTYNGTGMSAKLFYESKVAEAISLIVDKSKNMNTPKIRKKISDDDINSIRTVASYINDHYSYTINLDELSRIACMGTTKLKYTFKAVFKCTITEYIQNKRISQAEHIFLNTDLPINQVANIVGYKNASRFSELFRKQTGLLPKEFKKNCKIST